MAAEAELAPHDAALSEWTGTMRRMQQEFAEQQFDMQQFFHGEGHFAERTEDLLQ